MKHKFLAFIVLCGTVVCFGQTPFTTPLSPDDQTGSRNENQGKAPVQGVYTGLPSLNPAQQSEIQNVQSVVPSMRSARPKLAKSEFQQFAEDTAGRSLPVYGREIFDQVPTTFAPADQIPVSSEYVIGPGDEIVIRIWGKVSLDGHFTVDRNGQISLPKIGVLNIAGLRSDQLESRIHSAVSNMYRDFEINVTLGRLRSIQIYVLGSARQPGTYTVSSLSTLLNALFTSGGPSASGSMRHIQLRRGDQTIVELDLYRILRDGDKSQDAQLLSGDVIYIPPTGPQVAIFGSVKDPGIYELSSSEQVSSLLHLAGGLSALADTQKAIVEHIREHRARSVEEFALDATGVNRQIQDGDLLKVLPLSPQFENSVTLRGNVARPARYAWRPGMRITDLIPSRDALISRDYWNQKNHIIPADPARPFSEPASTQLREKVAAGTQMESEFRSNDSEAPALRQRSSANSVQVQSEERSGEKQLNSTFNAEETPTIVTVGKITAEINWEYAVIERLDPHDLSTHLIPFRLATAVDDPASPSNLVLMAGDVVTIFSRTDLELPMEKHAIFVRVGGEVNAPGIYRVNPGDTLQDAVRMSGGLTSHSYLYASRFTRTSVKHAEEDQLRQSSEQMQRDLMARYVRATPTPGQTGAEQDTELSRQRTAIVELSSIKPTGRIVLQIKPTAAAIEDIPTLPLEDGDTFYVPPRLSTVQVTGAVYNANAFRFQPGLRLSDYLNSAGGPTRDADKRRAFVIRADGTVVSKQASSSHFHGKFENLRLLPGDAIVMPQKLRGNGSRTLQDTVQIISQSAITAAALKTVAP